MIRIRSSIALPASLSAIVLCLALPSMRARQQAPLIADAPTGQQLLLPSGWRVKPAGHPIPLPGDMPLKMLFTPDGKYLVINTGGHHDHSVNLIDLASEKLTQSVAVQKDWAGLCLSERGDEVFVAGGGAPENYAHHLSERGLPQETITQVTQPILSLSLKEGKLALQNGVGVEGLDAKKRYIAGLAMGKNESLYAVDINDDTVYRLNGKLRSTPARSKVGYRPYAVILSPDKATLAVSNWGDKSVSLLDANDLTERKRVPVGSHPSEMAYSKDGRLFVTNGGDNTVSVVYEGEVIETINTALDPEAPIGSTPDAVAVSPDGKRLFVANAGNNDVAVIDISRFDARHHLCSSYVKGFIPTGWYPSALAVAPDGKKLYIGVGKGLYFRGSAPDADIPDASEVDKRYGGYFYSFVPERRKHFQYIGDVLNGAVSAVEIPDSKQLAAYTKQVRASGPLKMAALVKETQKQDSERALAHIKHVLYIIKENRTYDQVFSDIPGGNGDPKLLMYGQAITPNHHALAKRTVLLDNLYCSGEVSEDGHEWCNSAYATDFRQKGWVNSYSDRGEPDADGRLTDSPGGYLWDSCKRAGITYRSYGEFADFHASPTMRPVFDGNPTLDGHASSDWSQLNNVKDSRDTDYAGVFIKEMREAEKKDNWPQYMVMSLGEDHTSGLAAGAFTPSACVGANDQGLGKIVEAISHSKFWKETAIFVIEDDAQDGPDHVDAHRTVGLVISPYVKRGVVDSTFYTTNSMIATIEKILKLPPMTQFDAAAIPMFNAFTSQADFTPYTCLPPQIDLAARNPQKGEGVKQSAKLDFSQHDRADPIVLNRILWQDAHPGVPLPAPVRSGIALR